MPPHASCRRSRRGRRWLLTEGYAPATVTAYRLAARRFVRWAEQRGHGASLLAVGNRLDEHFADYLHDLHECGAGKAEAVNAFYGLNLLVPSSTPAMPLF